MKAIAVLAVVLLMCAFVHSAEVASESEIETTIAEMASIESTHSIVESLAAEAQAVQFKSGVTRLVQLLRKVLKRLRRSMKRGSKKMRKTRRVCKSSVRTALAIIKVTQRDLKVASVKYRINKNIIRKSKNDASLVNERISRYTADAGSFDSRVKSGRSSLKTKIGRLSRANTETLALVKLLRKINRKLTSNGLAEISSQLTTAAKSRAAESESTTMLLAVAAKAESGSDVSDVHDMIKLLIKALLSDIKINQRQISTSERDFQRLSRTLRDSADSERANIKSITRTRDGTLSSGDRAAKKNLGLRVQMRALKKTLKSTKKRLSILRKNCRSSKKGFVAKRRSYLRQIRVIKSIIKLLKNKKLSSATARKIANVKLNLPVWRVGSWSKCSAKCGLGKKTRRVSCSGSKCLGNKPRKSKSCTNGPCKADCVVSRWSSFSKCSAKCGGGIQKKTRKVLAQATRGGKACPAPSGLKMVRACNKQKCSKRTKRSVSKRSKRSNKRKVSKRSRKNKRSISKRSRKNKRSKRSVSKRSSKNKRSKRSVSKRSKKSKRSRKNKRSKRSISKRSKKSKRSSKNKRSKRSVSKRSKKSKRSRRGLKGKVSRALKRGGRGLKRKSGAVTRTSSGAGRRALKRGGRGLKRKMSRALKRGGRALKRGGRGLKRKVSRALKRGGRALKRGGRGLKRNVSRAFKGVSRAGRGSSHRHVSRPSAGGRVRHHHVHRHHVHRHHVHRHHHHHHHRRWHHHVRHHVHRAHHHVRRVFGRRRG